MRWIHAVAAAVAATGLVATSAHATLTGVTLVRVPIAAPVNSDTSGELANNVAFPRVFDIQVTQGAGEHWTVQTLNAALTAGTFFSPAVGNGDYLPEAPTNTSVDYDTALTSPDRGAATAHGAVAVAGQSDFSGQGTTGQGIMPGQVTGRDPNINPNAANQANTINVTWGQFAAQVNPDGTYTVARLTVLGKSAGTVNAGHLTGTQHLNAAPPDVPYAAMVIPLNGDFNGDGFTNGGDITAFKSALTNDAAYHAAFPAAYPVTAFYGDFNNDGFFNGGDISGFKAILSAAGTPLNASELAQLGSLVPEPASMGLIGAAVLAMASRRRRV